MQKNIYLLSALLFMVSCSQFSPLISSAQTANNQPLRQNINQFRFSGQYHESNAQVDILLNEVYLFSGVFTYPSPSHVSSTKYGEFKISSRCDFGSLLQDNMSVKQQLAHTNLTPIHNFEQDVCTIYIDGLPVEYLIFNQ